MLATFPKPKIFRIPVNPIKSQMNINIYRGFGKLYLCPLESKSNIKQQPKSPQIDPLKPPKRQLTDQKYCPRLLEIPVIKNKVKKIFYDNSLNELYSFALKIDHEYTSKVSKADIFRLTKLLEVYYQSNENITYFRNIKRKSNNYNFFKILHMPDKEIVKMNIENRFLDMVKEGLVKEVENSIDKVKESNVEKAIGFIEIKDYLSGKLKFDEAKDLIIKRTKSFAKRQYTWFNNRYNEDIKVNSIENVSLIVESFLKIN